MKKKILALALSLTLCVSLFPAAFAAGEGFADVPAGSWFEQGVTTCAEKGIMVGVGDGLFAPDKELSAAECLTLVYRLYDIQHGGDGSIMTAPVDWDGPNYWWRDVCYTIEQKRLDDVIDPTNFSDGSAFRWFFADALASAAGELEKINVIETLPDLEREEWNEGVYGLYEAGILTGVNAAGVFQGDKTLTRAEAAAMAARVLEPPLRVTFTPAVRLREYTLIPVDLQGWEPMDSYSGVSADWMPVVREADGAQQFGIYRADGTVFPLEIGIPFISDAPGTVRETRYATLQLRDDENDDWLWGKFDVTTGEMAVDFCDYETCLSLRQVLPPDPTQPDDIPLELLGFPYGTGDMPVYAWDGILSLCNDGIFRDYELAPVSQKFDWVGPLNGTGAGFVSQDGTVYRIQFEKAL